MIKHRFIISNILGCYIWCPSWGCGKTYPTVSRYLSFTHMVSTRSGLRHETHFEGSNPPPETMSDTDTFQQL